MTNLTKEEQAKRISGTVIELAETIKQKINENDFDGAGFFVDELKEYTDTLDKLTLELG
ncbi:hypothetical protein [Priestia aryabhattai]|uniref:hypothetical protein n=1 Tax=Priestia aryabhattai TaxID=412384 RepID=UPI0015F49ECE|nr:hypothetical protein [Priestia aryabhattai]